MASKKEGPEHIFDRDSLYPLVVRETVWRGVLRLDIRTHYASTNVNPGELRPTKKGVSLDAEKAAWLLPLLTQFVAAEADIDDSARDAIEASFALLQAVMLDGV